MPHGNLTTLDQSTIRFVILDRLELEKYYLYLFKILGEYLKYEFNKLLGIEISERPKVVQAINVNMAGHTVYVFELTIEEILKTCYVFRKKEVMDEGYQRLLNQKKLKDLNSFLRAGRANLFPNSILINLHGRIDEPTRTDFNMVELRYPMTSGSFNIIDGQHRVYGYCQSGLDLSAQRLIVVAFKDIPNPSDEIRFFLKINRMQTPIDPTLLSLLMAKVNFSRQEMGFWESQGSRLVLKLSQSGFYSNQIYKGGIIDKKTRGKPTLTSMAEYIRKTQLIAHPKKKKEIQEINDGFLQNVNNAEDLDSVVRVINTAVVLTVKWFRCSR